MIYNGFDLQFYQYLFNKIITDGGLRLQVIASDIVNELQKNYDSKHPLNLYRKQYGNIYEALKALKQPKYFKLDNMVIKMKQPEQIRKIKIIKAELMQKYEAKIEINKLKQIEIMKINSENRCKRCNEIYNIHVNKKGLCQSSQTSLHQPLHQ